MTARGTVFTGESRYPKDSPSDDPASYMSDDELIVKFRGNAEGVLMPASIDDAIDRIMNLERQANVETVMGLFRSTIAVREDS